MEKERGKAIVMKTNEELKQEIHKENELLKVFNAESERILSVLKKYEGKNIQKKDFTLLKKVSDEIEATKKEYSIIPLFVGKGAKIQYSYLSTSEYSLWIKLGVRFESENGENWLYISDDFYLAQFEKGLLCKVEPMNKPLLDEDEQIKNYHAMIEAEENFNSARDKVYFRLRKGY